MPASRRIFIKTSLGVLSAGLLAPSLLLENTQALAAGLTPNTDGFRVVKNGQAWAVIVTPDNPSGVVQYAAQELKWHLQRATGIELSVIAEQAVTNSPLSHYIYVGQGIASQNAGIVVDNLAPNSYRKKRTTDAVFLIGKDDTGKAPPLDDTVSMGTLFAVYDWLEHQVGVQWLWPDESGTIVPAATDVYAGTSGLQTVIPTLIHSRLRPNTWDGMDPDRKTQYVYDTNVWLRRQRFACNTSFDYGHAFSNYWDLYGTAHPNYFALRPDGVRAPANPARPELVQMCVSNHNLYKPILQDWLAQRQNTPNLPWVNGEENDKTDKDPSCTCDVCRSWDPPNAPLLDNQEERKAAIGDTSDTPLVSLSDRYAKFWLALQAKCEPYDPNATVIGYAYADYKLPPVATQLNDRIIVGIVAPGPFPLSEQEMQDFKDLWSGWAATGARLYLRPNFLLTGYCVPYIYNHQLGEIYKYAATHNMIGDDFSSLLGMWGVQGPNYYVLGRLNVDPTLEVEDILEQYYAGFDPAAAQVKAYFSYWEEVTNGCDTDFRTRVDGGWGSVSKGGDEVFTAATFVQGKQLLQGAQDAAAGNTEVTQRLDYLDLWQQHADLCMQTLAAYHASKANPSDVQLQQVFTQAKTAVDNFRTAHPDLIVNIGVLRQLEVWAGWREESEL